MEGYLDKWNKKTSEFERKYVVACSKRRRLFLYNSDDLSEINSPLCKISLQKALLSIDDSETTYFTLIINNNLHLRFKAPDITLRNEWISKISEISKMFRQSLCLNEESFEKSKIFLDILKESKNEFQESIQSYDQINSVCEPDLQKFSNLLDEVQSDIDELAIIPDEGPNAITLDDVDETSMDLFLECQDEIQPIPVLDDPNDFDPMEYDIESDSHEDEMTVNTSVITYLVSQVKIGMDLSRITLPTFILERRSLLEMYGDFFSRPSHLLEADKQTSAKERFLAVVKYYLGSFYPGRRIKAAKKPYNPVLGEKFMCFYKCSPDRSQCSNNTDGPVPWAKTCDFSFIAEQVSHHPPISAFYAECPKANVSCNAFVHTKSKFMGISIGVHNIGHGVLSLNNHNEEYIFSYPSGYARSIFSVPWFEFGGSCYLTCTQTGFRAQIEFICKPFLSYKKHKIKVDLFEPDAKKPFAIITGEWNGVMKIHYADNDNKDVFIDSLHEPINRKYVKPIPNQEPDESRLIWEGVTQSLKTKDIDKATEFKNKIEERQRQSCRERKEKWIPKYFKNTEDDGWIYVNPLKNRAMEQ